jgi:RHS repeat-associated protein
MDMPGRSVTPSDNYKYSFNGKLDDKSDGLQSQNFGLREYDNRLGKFFVRDPLSILAPNKTPYSFAANNPILFIDKNGAFVTPPELPFIYPKLNQMLLRIDAMVNDVNAQFNPILANLATAAGININTPQGLQILRDVLSYGTGPRLSVDNKMLGDLGLTNGNTFDISLSGALVHDNEINRFTRIFGFGSFYFKGKQENDYILNGATILSLFNTILHETGHHINLFYVGGAGAALRNSVKDANGFDNIDIGFEQPTWTRQISNSAQIKRRDIVRGDNNINARTIFGVNGNLTLTPFRLRQFFYPNGWENNKRDPYHIDPIQIKTIPTTPPPEPELRLPSK